MAAKLYMMVVRQKLEYVHICNKSLAATYGKTLKKTNSFLSLDLLRQIQGSFPKGTGAVAEFFLLITAK